MRKKGFLLVICLIIGVVGFSLINSESSETGKSIFSFKKIFGDKRTFNPIPKDSNPLVLDVNKKEEVRPMLLTEAIMTSDQLKKEEAFVSKIENLQSRNVLRQALNYELKPNEHITKGGDIVVKLRSGKEVVRLGYQEQKRFFESIQEEPSQDWNELNVLKNNIDSLYNQKILKKSNIVTPKVSKKHFKLPFLPFLGKVIGINNDDLNAINPLFHKADYNPNGFMYHAAELYNQGVFPFLPYLTPVKDQGYRGTCGSFAAVSAIELISQNHPDLSEQNHRYSHTVPNFENNVPVNPIKSESIGLESEWPYNSYHCILDGEDTLIHGGEGQHSYTSNASYYYSNLLTQQIPCSDTIHQGIWLVDHYEPYNPVMNSTQGRCFLSLHESLYNWDPANVTRYYSLLINDLKYPIVIAPGWIDNIDDVLDGFVEPGDITGPGHIVSVVGFIPKNKIPNSVKLHPSYLTNENYFIIKNSLGTDNGDSGFYYFPESVLINSYFGVTDVTIYKYDRFSSDFKNCPIRNFAGVTP